MTLFRSVLIAFLLVASGTFLGTHAMADQSDHQSSNQTSESESSYARTERDIGGATMFVSHDKCLSMETNISNSLHCNRLGDQQPNNPDEICFVTSTEASWTPPNKCSYRCIMICFSETN